MPSLAGTAKIPKFNAVSRVGPLSFFSEPLCWGQECHRQGLRAGHAWSEFPFVQAQCSVEGPAHWRRAPNSGSARQRLLGSHCRGRHSVSSAKINTRVAGARRRLTAPSRGRPASGPPLTSNVRCGGRYAVKPITPGNRASDRLVAKMPCLSSRVAKSIGVASPPRPARWSTDLLPCRTRRHCAWPSGSVPSFTHGGQ